MTTSFPLDPEINDTYLGYYWDGNFWKRSGFDSSKIYPEIINGQISESVIPDLDGGTA
jgi:hypothetical protein